MLHARRKLQRLFSTSSAFKPDLPRPVLVVDRTPAATQKIPMLPAEMVSHLDQYIVGQSNAKRAMAHALRFRWRRLQLSDDLRKEVTPRNILMFGPTGVGKTEIARRLADLVDAPFVKAEATQYTEVGFHGRDVDQIIADLVEVSMRKQRTILEEEFASEAESETDDKLVSLLVGNLSSAGDKEVWLQNLRSGALDSRMITVDLPIRDDSGGTGGFTFGGGGGDGSGGFSRRGLTPIRIITSGSLGSEKVRLTVKEARQRLLRVMLEKRISPDMVRKRAIERAEQEGVVFIDEIDKICAPKDGFYHGPDASGVGVQRDLLPIIEGTDLRLTDYGIVKTHHILFICAGAFTQIKPDDMLAELQGRLPIRVELVALSEADLLRILTERKDNLVVQCNALMRPEGIDVHFPQATCERIAKAAWDVNSVIQNIGARRLHTIVESVMQEISFNLPTRPSLPPPPSGEPTDTTTTTTSKTTTMAEGDLVKWEVTVDDVDRAVMEMTKSQNLEKFII